MAEENSLFDLLDFINSIKAERPNIDNYRDLELSNNEKYLFKPLENIPAKKGKKEEKRNGFLVYSQEKLNKDHYLYRRFESVYNNCKGFNIDNNENNIYRYYYFEEFIYPKRKPTKYKHATVIMLNPAFASSDKKDLTITNLKNFLRKKRFTSFDIVNLYSIRLPKSECLTCFISYLKLDDYKNYKNFLIKFLSTGSKNTLIAAWGNKYNVKAKEIFTSECGLQFHSYKKGEPAHFSSQRFNNVKRKGLFLFTPTELDA